MRNLNNDGEDNSYDYAPNELANLSTENPRKYREIVESNLERGDSVEKWERRNMERAKAFLSGQRVFRS